MAIKKLGQIRHKESKNKTSIKKHKRGWLIFGGVVVTLAVIGHVSNIMEQSRLEKDNVPIIISNVDENIKLDYHTDKREISAKISGVSLLAEVKVANGKTSILLYPSLTANATAIKSSRFTAKRKLIMTNKN